MPTKCTFVFDRSAPIYYSGEEICGHLRVQTTKKLVLTGIKLKLVGTAHVEWLEKYKLAQSIEHNDCTEQEISSICHSGTQTLLKNCIQLAEGITLEPGVAFEQTFHFILPQNCVTTCKQQYGEVAYKLQLVLKRQSTFNKIFQQRLVIRNYVDLNMLESCLSDHYVIKSEEGLEFSLPYCGFVPGQLMRFTLSSANYAIGARKILILLNQHCQYSALEPAAKNKGITTTLTRHKIEKPTVILLGVRGNIRVPLRAPSSTLDGDCLMRISYYISIVVVGAKKKILEKLNVPIVIGTIPLQIASDGCMAENADADNDHELYCYDNFVAPAVRCNYVNKKTSTFLASIRGTLTKFYKRLKFKPVSLKIMHLLKSSFLFIK